MTQPFKLAADHISHETIECLEDLLDQAKHGQIVGIAYAAMLKQRDYIVNTAGEAYSNPTFSRGMIRALDDEIGRRVFS